MKLIQSKLILFDYSNIEKMTQTISLLFTSFGLCIVISEDASEGVEKFHPEFMNSTWNRFFK